MVRTSLGKGVREGPPPRDPASKDQKVGRREGSTADRGHYRRGDSKCQGPEVAVHSTRFSQQQEPMWLPWGVSGWEVGDDVGDDTRT